VSVLHIMAGHGFIRSFDIKNRAFIIIWLKGLRGVSGVWHPSFRDAQRVPHYRRNPESISRKLIRRLSSADGGSSLYLLSTDMGIMTHLDAIRHNVGGKLLFKII
jgi:ribosomal protein S8